MVKSMVPMAMVEKNKGLNQWCLWQWWKKTIVKINGDYGNGGKKQRVKSMVPMAMVENKTMVNQWSFPSSFRNQWKPMDKNSTNVCLKDCDIGVTYLNNLSN